jgi:hypothetical protein
MDIHKNARLTPHSRARLVRRIVDAGQSAKAVATIDPNDYRARIQQAASAVGKRAIHF